MQTQTVFLESLKDDPVHSLSVAPQLEAHDKIIGISNQKGFASQDRLDHFLPPQVQHLMQVDVTEQWTDHSSLRCALVGIVHLSFLHNPSIKPFAYQPEDDSILYPVLKNFPQAPVVQCVEKLPYIDIQYPSGFLVHDLPPHRFQC